MTWSSALLVFGTTVLALSMIFDLAVMARGEPIRPRLSFLWAKFVLFALCVTVLTVQWFAWAAGRCP